MDKEFRTYMEAIGAEFEAAPGDHPSQEELIDYHEGRGDSRRREELQSHLMACGECLTAFKNISDFFSPALEDEEEVSDLEIRRQWDAFSQRAETRRQSSPIEGEQRRRSALFSSRAALALAASLLLAAGLALVWAMMLRQENQRLTDRLLAEERDSTTQMENLERRNRDLQERASSLEQDARRAERLERENRELQQQAAASRENLQTELSRLRQPEMNAPLYDIFSRDFNRRSGNEEGANRIKVPPTAQSVVLILSGEGQPDAQTYRIEMANSRGRIIWRGDGLKRDAHGNFVIRLNRESVSEGEYSLKLYGRREGRSRMLVEYILLVE